jgi:hypothetical protein
MIPVKHLCIGSNINPIMPNLWGDMNAHPKLDAGS